MNFELNNFRPNNEVNSIVPERKYTSKTPVIEIFTAMVNGKDTSKYGDKANKTYAYIKKLADEAKSGSGKAKAELNTITAVQIEAPLLQRLQLFSFMGNVRNLSYDEKLVYRVYKLQGKMSGFQASQSDVPFGSYTWEERPFTTQNISGGMAINYRELATGNFNGQGILAEQVVTDMTNKVFAKVISDLYTKVKAATGIKNFAEAAGITKTSIMTVLKKARRWGNVGIFGDYDVISQINEMAGFNTDSAGNLAKQLPEATITEIMKTGLINSFMGTTITEIPNKYNLTKLNTAADYYDLYLPNGILFFLVSGEMSPLQICYRGGLTSKSGFSITDGNELTRYDLEMGDAIIDEYIPQMGMISDTNFTQTIAYE